MRKLTLFVALCILLPGPILVGQNTGKDKAVKSDSGKKATKSKKEAEAISAPMPVQKRFDLLPPKVAAAIVTEEAQTNSVLAECRQARDPKTCRSNAIIAYSRRVSAILSGVKPTTKMGGHARVDCLGDTRQSVSAECPTGTHVDKVSVPCTNCVVQHVSQASGDCFLYACFHD